jgi:hypothetical protein
LLGHSLEVGWVYFSGLTVLDVFDAAAEVNALQLKVQGVTVFHGSCNLPLGVRLENMEKSYGSLLETKEQAHEKIDAAITHFSASNGKLLTEK